VGTVKIANMLVLVISCTGPLGRQRSGLYSVQSESLYPPPHLEVCWC
jgi:hypothetical protein